MQRWRTQEIGDDRRAGPTRPPGNRLSEAERRRIIESVSGPEFRDLPPTQIVPILAERGIYLASESTIYRLLREERLATRRESSRPPAAKPAEFVATAPNQVWSWDITYLPTSVRGAFYYLYMIVDVFSRKVVGAVVHDRESGAHAAAMIRGACAAEGLEQTPLVLHSDNGGPMKASTMLATLQELGVAGSFSRPRVSDDNPFSEALFRTVKYRPEYPSRPFATLEEARSWVAWFVRWYNHEHRHSAISFVTPTSATPTSTSVSCVDDAAPTSARGAILQSAGVDIRARGNAPTSSGSTLRSGLRPPMSREHTQAATTLTHTAGMMRSDAANWGS